MKDKTDTKKDIKIGLVEVVTAVGTFLTSLAIYLYKSHANKGLKR